MPITCVRHSWDGAAHTLEYAKRKKKVIEYARWAKVNLFARLPNK